MTPPAEERTIEGKPVMEWLEYDCEFHLAIIPGEVQVTVMPGELGWSITDGTRPVAHAESNFFPTKEAAQLHAESLLREATAPLHPLASLYKAEWEQNVEELSARVKHGNEQALKLIEKDARIASLILEVDRLNALIDGGDTAEAAIAGLEKQLAAAESVARRACEFTVEDTILATLKRETGGIIMGKQIIDAALSRARAEAEGNGGTN